MATNFFNEVLDNKYGTFPTVEMELKQLADFVKGFPTDIKKNTTTSINSILSGYIVASVLRIKGGDHPLYAKLTEAINSKVNTDTFLFKFANAYHTSLKTLLARCDPSKVNHVEKIKKGMHVLSDGRFSSSALIDSVLIVGPTVIDIVSSSNTARTGGAAGDNNMTYVASAPRTVVPSDVLKQIESKSHQYNQVSLSAQMNNVDSAKFQIANPNLGFLHHCVDLTAALTFLDSFFQTNTQTAVDRSMTTVLNDLTKVFRVIMHKDVYAGVIGLATSSVSAGPEYRSGFIGMLRQTVLRLKNVSSRLEPLKRINSALAGMVKSLGGSIEDLGVFASDVSSSRTLAQSDVHTRLALYRACIHISSTIGRCTMVEYLKVKGSNISADYDALIGASMAAEIKKIENDQEMISQILDRLNSSPSSGEISATDAKLLNYPLMHFYLPNAETGKTSAIPVKKVFAHLPHDISSDIDSADIEDNYGTRDARAWGKSVPSARFAPGAHKDGKPISGGLLSRSIDHLRSFFKNHYEGHKNFFNAVVDLDLYLAAITHQIAKMKGATIGSLMIKPAKGAEAAVRNLVELLDPDNQFGPSSEELYTHRAELNSSSGGSPKLRYYMAAFLEPQIDPFFNRVKSREHNMFDENNIYATLSTKTSRPKSLVFVAETRDSANQEFQVKAKMERAQTTTEYLGAIEAVLKLFVELVNDLDITPAVFASIGLTSPSLSTREVSQAIMKYTSVGCMKLDFTTPTIGEEANFPYNLNCSVFNEAFDAINIFDTNVRIGVTNVNDIDIDAFPEANSTLQGRGNYLWTQAVKAVYTSLFTAYGIKDGSDSTVANIRLLDPIRSVIGGTGSVEELSVDGTPMMLTNGGVGDGSGLVSGGGGGCGCSNATARFANKTGGSNDSSVALPALAAVIATQVHPDAAEMYIRLTLYADFYNYVLNPKMTDKDASKVAMIPSMGEVYSDLLLIMFNRGEDITNSTFEYTPAQIEAIVGAINKIYTHVVAKKKSMNTELDIVSLAVFEMASIISRVYGIMFNNDHAKFFAAMQKNLETTFGMNSSHMFLNSLELPLNINDDFLQDMATDVSFVDNNNNGGSSADMDNARFARGYPVTALYGSHADIAMRGEAGKALNKFREANRENLYNNTQRGIQDSIIAVRNFKRKVYTVLMAPTMGDSAKSLFNSSKYFVDLNSNTDDLKRRLANTTDQSERMRILFEVFNTSINTTGGSLHKTDSSRMLVLYDFVINAATVASEVLSFCEKIRTRFDTSVLMNTTQHDLVFMDATVDGVYGRIGSMNSHSITSVFGSSSTFMNNGGNYTDNYSGSIANAVSNRPRQICAIGGEKGISNAFALALTGAESAYHLVLSKGGIVGVQKDKVWSAFDRRKLPVLSAMIHPSNYVTDDLRMRYSLELVELESAKARYLNDPTEENDAITKSIAAKFNNVENELLVAIDEMQLSEKKRSMKKCMNDTWTIYDLVKHCGLKYVDKTRSEDVYAISKSAQGFGINLLNANNYSNTDAPVFDPSNTVNTFAAPSDIQDIRNNALSRIVSNRLEMNNPLYHPFASHYRNPGIRNALNDGYNVLLTNLNTKWVDSHFNKFVRHPTNHSPFTPYYKNADNSYHFSLSRIGLHNLEKRQFFYTSPGAIGDTLADETAVINRNLASTTLTSDGFNYFNPLAEFDEANVQLSSADAYRTLLSGLYRDAWAPPVSDDGKLLDLPHIHRIANGGKTSNLVQLDNIFNPNGKDVNYVNRHSLQYIMRNGFASALPFFDITKEQGQGVVNTFSRMYNNNIFDEFPVVGQNPHPHNYVGRYHVTPLDKDVLFAFLPKMQMELDRSIFDPINSGEGLLQLFHAATKDATKLPEGIFAHIYKGQLGGNDAGEHYDINGDANDNNVEDFVDLSRPKSKAYYNSAVWRTHHANMIKQDALKLMRKVVAHPNLFTVSSDVHTVTIDPSPARDLLNTLISGMSTILSNIHVTNPAVSQAVSQIVDVVKIRYEDTFDKIDNLNNTAVEFARQQTGSNDPKKNASINSFKSALTAMGSVMSCNSDIIRQVIVNPLGASLDAMLTEDKITHALRNVSGKTSGDVYTFSVDSFKERDTVIAENGNNAFTITNAAPTFTFKSIGINAIKDAAVVQLAKLGAEFWETYAIAPHGEKGTGSRLNFYRMTMSGSAGGFDARLLAPRKRIGNRAQTNAFVYFEPVEECFNGSGIFGFDVVSHFNNTINQYLKSITNSSRIYTVGLPAVKWADSTSMETIDNTIGGVEDIRYLPGGLDFSDTTFVKLNGVNKGNKDNMISTSFNMTNPYYFDHADFFNTYPVSVFISPLTNDTTYVDQYHHRELYGTTFASYRPDESIFAQYSSNNKLSGIKLAKYDGVNLTARVVPSGAFNNGLLDPTVVPGISSFGSGSRMFNDGKGAFHAFSQLRQVNMPPEFNLHAIIRTNETNPASTTHTNINTNNKFARNILIPGSGVIDSVVVPLSNVEYSDSLDLFINDNGLLYSGGSIGMRNGIDYYNNNMAMHSTVTDMKKYLECSGSTSYAERQWRKSLASRYDNMYAADLLNSNHLKEELASRALIVYDPQSRSWMPDMMTNGMYLPNLTPAAVPLGKYMKNSVFAPIEAARPFPRQLAAGYASLHTMPTMHNANGVREVLPIAMDSHYKLQETFTRYFETAYDNHKLSMRGFSPSIGYGMKWDPLSIWSRSIPYCGSGMTDNRLVGLMHRNCGVPLAMGYDASTMASWLFEIQDYSSSFPSSGSKSSSINSSLIESYHNLFSGAASKSNKHTRIFSSSGSSTFLGSGVWYASSLGRRDITFGFFKPNENTYAQSYWKGEQVVAQNGNVDINLNVVEDNIGIEYNITRGGVSSSNIFTAILSIANNVNSSSSGDEYSSSFSHILSELLDRSGSSNLINLAIYILNNSTSGLVNSSLKASKLPHGLLDGNASLLGGAATRLYDFSGFSSPMDPYSIREFDNHSLRANLVSDNYSFHDIAACDWATLARMEGLKSRDFMLDRFSRRLPVSTTQSVLNRATYSTNTDDEIGIVGCVGNYWESLAREVDTYNKTVAIGSAAMVPVPFNYDTITKGIRRKLRNFSALLDDSQDSFLRMALKVKSEFWYSSCIGKVIEQKDQFVQKHDRTFAKTLGMFLNEKITLAGREVDTKSQNYLSIKLRDNLQTNTNIPVLLYTNFTVIKNLCEVERNSSSVGGMYRNTGVVTANARLNNVIPNTIAESIPSQLVGSGDMSVTEKNSLYGAVVYAKYQSTALKNIIDTATSGLEFAKSFYSFIKTESKPSTFNNVLNVTKRWNDEFLVGINNVEAALRVNSDKDTSRQLFSSNMFGFMADGARYPCSTPDCNVYNVAPYHDPHNFNTYMTPDSFATQSPKTLHEHATDFNFASIATILDPSRIIHDVRKSSANWSSINRNKLIKMLQSLLTEFYSYSVFSATYNTTAATAAAIVADPVTLNVYSEVVAAAVADVAASSPNGVPRPAAVAAAIAPHVGQSNADAIITMLPAILAANPDATTMTAAEFGAALQEQVVATAATGRRGNDEYDEESNPEEAFTTVLDKNTVLTQNIDKTLIDRLIAEAPSMPIESILWHMYSITTQRTIYLDAIVQSINSKNFALSTSKLDVARHLFTKIIAKGEEKIKIKPKWESEYRANAWRVEGKSAADVNETTYTAPTAMGSSTPTPPAPELYRRRGLTARDPVRDANRLAFRAKTANGERTAAMDTPKRERFVEGGESSSDYEGGESSDYEGGGNGGGAEDFTMMGSRSLTSRDDTSMRMLEYSAPAWLDAVTETDEETGISVTGRFAWIASKVVYALINIASINGAALDYSFSKTKAHIPIKQYAYNRGTYNNIVDMFGGLRKQYSIATEALSGTPSQATLYNDLSTFPLVKQAITFNNSNPSSANVTNIVETSVLKVMNTICRIKIHPDESPVKLAIAANYAGSNGAILNEVNDLSTNPAGRFSVLRKQIAVDKVFTDKLSLLGNVQDDTRKGVMSYHYVNVANILGNIMSNSPEDEVFTHVNKIMESVLNINLTGGSSSDKGGNSAASKNLERFNLIAMNILDMGIFPIDYNALTRDIPLFNIVNGATAFDDIFMFHNQIRWFNKEHGVLDMLKSDRDVLSKAFQDDLRMKSFNGSNSKHSDRGINSLLNTVQVNALSDYISNPFMSTIIATTEHEDGKMTRPIPYLGLHPYRGSVGSVDDYKTVSIRSSNAHKLSLLRAPLPFYNSFRNVGGSSSDGQILNETTFKTRDLTFNDGARDNESHMRAADALFNGVDAVFSATAVLPPVDTTNYETYFRSFINAGLIANGADRQRGPVLDNAINRIMNYIVHNIQYSTGKTIDTTKIFNGVIRNKNQFFDVVDDVSASMVKKTMDALWFIGNPTNDSNSVNEDIVIHDEMVAPPNTYMSAVGLMYKHSRNGFKSLADYPTLFTLHNSASSNTTTGNVYSSRSRIDGSRMMSDAPTSNNAYAVLAIPSPALSLLSIRNSTIHTIRPRSHHVPYSIVDFNNTAESTGRMMNGKSPSLGIRTQHVMSHVLYSEDGFNLVPVRTMFMNDLLVSFFKDKVNSNSSTSSVLKFNNLANGQQQQRRANRGSD